MRLTIVLPWLWLLFCSLCYAAVWVSPAVFWPAAFVAMLGVPMALMGSTLLFGLSFLGKWKRNLTLATVLCLLLGWPFIKATIGWHKPAKTAPEHTIKVISFNLGKHIEGEDMYRFERRKYYTSKTMAWLLAQPADVLLLQEAFNYTPVTEFQIVRQLRKSGYKHTYFARHTYHTNTDGAGMLIAARVPITNTKVVWGPAGSLNMILSADIKLQQTDIRLLNVHLQSIRLSLDELSWQKPWRHIAHNVRNVIKKMRKAYISRAAQVDALVQAIEQSPYPVLLGGDFNDTPYSYTYWRIHRLLQSSFEQGGSGFGNTFNGKRIKTGLRIDHQFSKSPLRCLQLQTIDSVPYSDHYPLVGMYQVYIHSETIESL